LVVMFHPSGDVALVAAVIVLVWTVWGVIRHRKIGSPKSQVQLQPAS
jgi:hypothetical protein